MRLEIIEPVNSEVWNKAVQNSINGTLYHSWEWLKIIEKHSASRLHPLVFFDSDDGRPFAVMPLFYMQKMGVKMVFSPPPGSAVTLGPALVDKGYRQHKFELAYLDFQFHLDRFIKKLGADYVLFITSPGLLDVRPFSWAGYEVKPCYTYKLDLSQGEESIWGNFSRSLRTNIRSASRRGIKIVESTEINSTESLYNLLRQRYARQGLSLPLKSAYLRELFTQFGRSALKSYLAVYEGKVVGAMTCVINKSTFVSWVGGVRSESNNLEANELLMWHTIAEAIKAGLRWYEIEGANTCHLCDAKSRYGPALDIYFQIKRAGIAGSIAEKLYTLMKKSRKDPMEVTRKLT